MKKALMALALATAALILAACVDLVDVLSQIEDDL